MEDKLYAISGVYIKLNSDGGFNIVNKLSEIYAKSKYEAIGSFVEAGSSENPEHQLFRAPIVLEINQDTEDETIH